MSWNELNEKWTRVFLISTPIVIILVLILAILAGFAGDDVTDMPVSLLFAAAIIFLIILGTALYIKKRNLIVYIFDFLLYQFVIIPVLALTIRGNDSIITSILIIETIIAIIIYFASRNKPEPN